MAFPKAKKGFEPKRICKIEGCDSSCGWGGICEKHRQRIKKHGDPFTRYGKREEMKNV